MGAFLVQHLEPHRLQFAIATALMVVFLLMAFPHVNKGCHVVPLKCQRLLTASQALLAQIYADWATKGGCLLPLL